MRVACCESWKALHLRWRKTVIVLLLQLWCFWGKYDGTDHISRSWSARSRALALLRSVFIRDQLWLTVPVIRFAVGIWVLIDADHIVWILGDIEALLTTSN